jgi:glucose-6-phosphate isomerase
MMAGHESAEPQRVHPGSRALSLIAFERLDPATLGALVALYEHKVFVESVLWDVNPFDQWGVELGKVLAKRVEPALTEGAEVPGLDESTKALVAKYRALRGRS